MKGLKILATFLTISILAIGLASSFACSAPEPEVVEEAIKEEPPATAEDPEVAEEPKAPEEPADVEEDPEAVEEEEATKGELELLWSLEHEDQKFGLDSIAVSPDGKTVVVGGYLTTYTHLLYDGTLIDANTAHFHSVDVIDFSPDGSVMGVGLGVGGTQLIDMSGNSEPLQLHGGYEGRIAFSPAGEYVATGNRNGILWVWRIDDGEKIAALEEPMEGWNNICDIDYHPTGKLIASSHWEDIVHIWDIEKEQVIHKLDISTDYKYNNFQFSPDGEVMAGLVQENWDYMIRLWTVDGAEKLLDIPLPKASQSLSFSPDGSMLAIGSIYSESTIQDVSTGNLLYALPQEMEDGVIDGTLALAFTADGGHLAVIRYNGILEMWRLPGAEPFDEPEFNIIELPPLPSDVLFDTGSSDLKPGADEVLDEFASDLATAVGQAAITFIGHTDSRGDASSNLQLSIDRAAAVRDWFENWAQENDVDGWDLLVDGKGDTELKVDDVDAEGNFRDEAGNLNRRVEIEIEESS